SADAKLAHKVSTSSPTDSTHSSGGGSTAGGGGGGDEGDLGLLRDGGGKSDDGGKDDDSKSDGDGIRISFPVSIRPSPGESSSKGSESRSESG
ncbi:hypothetical protein Tco_1099557, partial [Tanacetum coccineum]